MIKKNALEALYKRAEEDKLDACIFSAEFIYENEELRQKFSSNPAVYKGTYPDVMNGMIDNTTEAKRYTSLDLFLKTEADDGGEDPFAALE